MMGTGWAFAESYCKVNTWEISCVDPNGNELVVDSLGTLSGTSDCSLFDFSLFLDGQLLDETIVPY